MPTEKEVLQGLLSKVYQFDNDGVTALYNADGTELNPDALDAILAKDAERVANLKPDVEKIKADQYKRGASETMSKIEKDLALEYGFKTDKKGIEFFREAINQFKIDHADDPEKIRKHKVFLDEMERISREKEESVSQITSQFETYKKTVEKEKLFGNIVEDALVLFESYKPLLPDDPAKAANLKKVFINDLSKQDYDIREGKKVLLNPDGSDKLDDHGHRIPFETFVKETYDRYFESQVSDPKQSPTHNQKNKQTSTVFNITSEQQYAELRLTVKPEDKQALVTAYNKWRGIKEK